MAILTNYDQVTNNNKPGKWNLIQIRSDYDKKTECQTSLKEGMVCVEITFDWKFFFHESWHFLEKSQSIERRKSNSEYQRASTLFKSRWLCNTCSQIFMWKVVYFRFFLVNEEFLKDDQKSRVSEFQSFFEEKSVLFY